MENGDIEMEKLTEIYKRLTNKQKKAVCWFLKNIEIAEELSRGKKISKDEIINFIEKAVSKEDYIMALLLLYKQRIDEDSK